MQYHTHAGVARLACHAALAHQALVSPSCVTSISSLYTATTETIRARKENTLSHARTLTHSHFRPRPRDSPRGLCSAATLTAAGPMRGPV